MIFHDVETQRPRDPGLQAERTALSWNRTGLAVFANALLALRSGWVNKEVPITLLAFALLVASAAAFLYGAWRRRQLLGGQGASAPPAMAIATATVVALTTCVIGVASIVLR
ncbi:MAG: DUF202 domain-containing protein [Pseudomonas sp.]|uniref:DUF202 domain-containing protein n=1 Tax=Pseudomonas abieticivorans TaxID=2931382 RepID=UPI0020C070D4|nr:DUF202 domain-containing protein [Pseudomonas sp. PIA16]MDE1167721.1 DUF202 domain-containing protein [Pseudomonas sp.]